MCKRRQGEELSMRKVKEILRLGFECSLGFRDIARSCGVSHPTVRKYLSAAKGLGIGWPQLKDMNEEDIYNLLKQNRLKAKSRPPAPMPDYSNIHNELKKKNVTLWLLWQEYKENDPQGE